MGVGPRRSVVLAFAALMAAVLPMVASCRGASDARTSGGALPQLPDDGVRSVRLFFVMRRQSAALSMASSEDLGRWDPVDLVLPGSEAVTDLAVGLSQTYVATCCDRAHHGQVHQIGFQFEATASRLSWYPGPLTFIDPTNRAEDRLDVAVFDVVRDTTSLVASTRSEATLTLTPRSVVWSGVGLHASGPHAVALEGASAGACAIAGLGSAVFLLLGTVQGNDPCVGDRAQVLDLASGTFGPVLALPRLLRGIDSDAESKLLGVTTAGELVLGDFAGPDPRWSSIRTDGHVVAAAFG